MTSLDEKVLAWLRPLLAATVTESNYFTRPCSSFIIATLQPLVCIFKGAVLGFINAALFYHPVHGLLNYPL